jgi:hypothetical protein
MIMKSKFKLIWQDEQSPLILTELTKHKKDQTYDLGKPGPGLFIIDIIHHWLWLDSKFWLIKLIFGLFIPLL